MAAIMTTPSQNFSLISDVGNFSNASGKNDSNGCGTGETSKIFRDFHFALVWVLFAAIIIGNSVVLAAVGLSKSKRRTRMTFFIFNLALADLFVGLFSVFYENMLLTMGHFWYGGWFLCAYACYLSDVVTYSSSYVLVALSIDRLHAIARPMSFTSSGLRAKILIAVAWALAFLFSIPQLIYRSVIYNPQTGGNECQLMFPHNWYFRPYFSLILLAAVFIPAVIISACYIAIIYIIWTKGKAAASGATTRSVYKARSTRTERKRGQAGSGENHVTDTECSSRGVIPKAKIRTIKMTLVIVLAFILCWSPFSLYNLVAVYEAMPCFRYQYVVTMLFQSLAPLNSAANPIIYGIFSTRVCQHLRRVSLFDWVAKWFCCCCCPPHVHPPGGASAMANTEYSTVHDTELHTRVFARKSSRDRVSKGSLREEIVLQEL